MVMNEYAVAHMDSDKCVKTGFSCPLDLLSQLDKRAKALRLNRSQYLRLLVEEDVAKGGSRTIKPASSDPERN